MLVPILTDRGAWLALGGRLQIGLLLAADPSLSNPYGIIAVNPARHDQVNCAATRRIDRSDHPAQHRIAEYRIGGQALFEPVAKWAQ